MSNNFETGMTPEDTAKFKELFRAYCRQEVNAGHCDPDNCEFCSIDAAYNKIFGDTSEA